MNQSITEAIKIIESITASRYYTERGRLALIDTVAAGLYLTAQDKQALVLAQQTQYAKLQDVRNARMLLVGTRYNDVAAMVLDVRKETLTEKTQLPFNDKNSWLQYVRQVSQSSDADAKLEAACFHCAIGQRDQAYDLLLAAAKEGNLTALWLALGLAVQEGNEDAECVLLNELCVLYDQGIIDELPMQMRARLKQLVSKGHSTAGDFAFDFGRNKIGF